MAFVAPVAFDEIIFGRICELVASGESLPAVLSAQGMPSWFMFQKWLRDNDDARVIYLAARESRVEFLAEETLQIADDKKGDSFIDNETGEVRSDSVNVQRDKLRIDTRKWYASKIMPRQYGDKITQEVTGANGTPLIPAPSGYDVSKLTTEELKTLREITTKAIPSPMGN